MPSQSVTPQRPARVTPSQLPGTQQDAVYARLRQLLTVGRFVTGERLKIRQMAAELGVGQMPVRAALQRLASEGALVNSPNAGVAVPSLSVAEFDDLLNMRLLLEGEAAARGALALSQADCEQMEQWCHDMDLALAQGQLTAYLQANDALHVRLYRASGSDLLFSLIDTLWLKAGPLSNALFQDPAALPLLNRAHHDLMQALHQRNSLAARQAIERDLFVAGQYLRAGLVKAASAGHRPSTGKTELSRTRGSTQPRPRGPAI